jgi:hypothetical protein
MHGIGLAGWASYIVCLEVSRTEPQNCGKTRMNHSFVNLGIINHTESGLIVGFATIGESCNALT